MNKYFLINNWVGRNLTGFALGQCVSWAIWEHDFNFNNPTPYPIFSKLWLMFAIGKKDTNKILMSV